MNREKLLMTVVGIVLGLFVFDKAILGPLTNGWKERDKEIGFLVEDVTKGRQLVERESMLRLRWAQMQQRALPASRSEAESSIFKKLDDWSSSARLKSNRIIPNWRDEQEYSTLSFRIEATGDMEAVMRFIYDLEGEKLALRIESFDLASNDKRGRDLSLDMTLSGLELPPEKTQ